MIIADGDGDDDQLLVPPPPAEYRRARCALSTAPRPDRVSTSALAGARNRDLVDDVGEHEIGPGTAEFGLGA